ncbi:MAG: alpha/beta hydrolase [Myxococcota bacterium]
MKTKAIGSGDVPLVLLNDWFGDHRTYEPALPYLDDRRLVFADLRGYGLARDQDGFTLDDAVADVSGLLSEIGPADLVGHSMSSLVAQQVAVSRPESVRRLVLVTPVSPGGMGTPDDVIAWLEQVGREPAQREAALGARMAARYGPAWARFKLARWADAARPEAVAAYVRMYSRGRVTGAAPPGLRALAIVGMHDDPPFKAATVREQHGAFWPDLEVVELPSGHYPMQECPPAFAGALTAFLDGPGPASQGVPE